MKLSGTENKFIRALQLIWIHARANNMDRTQDPHAFVLIYFGLLIRLITTIVFFKALYLQTPSLAGWSLPQTYVLVGTFMLINSIGWATYIRGASKLPRLIDYGKLDLLLTQPIKLPFSLTWRFMDAFFIIPEIITALAVIIYGIVHSHLPINLPFYFLALVCGFIIHYSLSMLLFSVNFFRIVYNSTYLHSQLIQLGRYPKDIYLGTIKQVLLIALPVATIFSLPVEALFGQINTWETLILIGVTIGFFIFYKIFWRFAERQYTSANG